MTIASISVVAGTGAALVAGPQGLQGAIGLPVSVNLKLPDVNGGITLVPSDIGAYTTAQVDAALSSVVTAGLPSIASGAVLANAGATPTGAAATTVTALLDRVFGSTRGVVLARGATTWGGVTLGASGTTLQSNGSDPVWVAGGGGTVTSVGAGAGLKTASGSPVTASGTILADPSFYPGFMFGLTLSNDASTPGTVLDVAAGVCVSSDQTTFMKLASAFTKNCNAAWAAGTGNGVLDAGSTLAASTWYYVHVIQGASAPDILVSTSAAAPTLPSGYTKFRRIGAFLTTGASAITPFLQSGRRFVWATHKNDYASGTAVATGAGGMTLTLSVPPVANVEALIEAQVVNTSGSFVLLTSMDEVDVAASASAFSTYAGSAAGVGGLITTIKTVSSQVRIRASAASTTLNLMTKGWTDPLGTVQ